MGLNCGWVESEILWFCHHVSFSTSWPMQQRSCCNLSPPWGKKLPGIGMAYLMPHGHLWTGRRATVQSDSLEEVCKSAVAQRETQKSSACLPAPERLLQRGEHGTRAMAGSTVDLWRVLHCSSLLSWLLQLSDTLISQEDTAGTLSFGSLRRREPHRRLQLTASWIINAFSPLLLIHTEILPSTTYPHVLREQKPWLILRLLTTSLKISLQIYLTD